MQNRNLNDLYAFTQVVKLGNFSRAAQSLGVQPSALSHGMNDLENRLNTKLLNRTTRSMSPTGAGQRLYERIAPMFGGIQEELAALGDLRGKVSGRLRINAAENPDYYLIYPKVRSFLAAFPEVDVEILISNSWSDIVAQGFDFGVRPFGDVAQDMVAVPISGERAMCVVAAPDYLTRHGQPETPPNWRNIAASCPRSTPLTAWTTGSFSKTGKSTACACPPASPSTTPPSSKPPPSTAWG